MLRMPRLLALHQYGKPHILKTYTIYMNLSLILILIVILISAYVWVYHVTGIGNEIFFGYGTIAKSLLKRFNGFYCYVFYLSNFPFSLFKVKRFINNYNFSQSSYLYTKPFITINKINITVLVYLCMGLMLQTITLL